MFKKIPNILAAALLLTTAAFADEARPTGAVVQVQDLGEIKIHSYTAPQEMFAMSTYIIESDNALVLIDGQMFTPFANDYRAYADGLGKPIDRLLLTHGHPDHYLGLVAFADVPLYALASTIEEIAETGEATRVARREMMGDIIPDSVVVPSETLEAGSEVIDGVTYEFSALQGGEHEPMLITRLPEHGVISVGDTAMNSMHMFLAGKPETWIPAIAELSADDSYNIVLPGHGLPGNQDMFAENTAYLTKASELLGTAKTGPEFRAGMIEAFPDLGVPGAIDFFLPYLFPNG
ncbi:hypothetical protein C1J03_22495 [Sulfitobacter sp. SK012]|uniref:MBL fold metallo-hydrolase n=1 Tax=Sulfitobacter sp. SK012 TaxID=1389005 RepID=UPI000E0C162A|nr:MBL fold metallo-hydrolase [Sulfitobacter sp. SK012]AXI48518.1 hypothetical protein C1J03_22495 [Sulfitobacter sp. SK012]